MASVFLRNPDGAVVEQPAEVVAWFLGRGWEITTDPSIAEAEAAAREAERVAALLAEAAADGAEKAAAAAERAEEVKANSNLDELAAEAGDDGELVDGELVELDEDADDAEGFVNDDGDAEAVDNAEAAEAAAQSDDGELVDADEAVVTRGLRRHRNQ